MSTINYTYNVIVDRFRQFAAGHFQLRRFTHGEISQADLEKEAEWPWLHVKPRAINYSPGTRAFSFEVFISDLPRDKEDKTGYQAESITDCSLIFQDLINEIYLGNMFGSDVVLTRPVNSEPFVEQYTHTLTGVTGIIELSLDYDWSACSIPASWNYNTPTNSPNDGFGALQFIDSLHQDGVFVSLDNDEEAPGNSYYYGTDASGVKGWYAIVDNIGLTCETLPDCAVIISIVDDIATLQGEMLLKANSADLGATAFSNSYNDLDDKPTIPSIAGLVPETRTLTINGTTQDLSADRTFTIATGLTVGTTPITSGTVGRILFEGTGNVLQESANLFWDNTNSRLGIGNTSPSQKLDILGTNVVATKIKSSTNTGAAAYQAFNDVDSSYEFGMWGSTRTGYGAISPGNAYLYGSVDLAITSLSNIKFGVGVPPSERMRITNTGNFLINTTTDAGFKLDVNGTARVSGNLTIGSTSTLWRISTDVVGSGGNPGGYLNWMYNDNFIYYRQFNQSGFHNYETTGGSDYGHRFISQGTVSLTIRSNGNVLIGTNTNIASSKLTVSSTTQGFLPPRMTTTEKNAISSPASGLIVYDNTLNALNYYNGTAWTDGSQISPANSLYLYYNH